MVQMTVPSITTLLEKVSMHLFFPTLLGPSRYRGRVRANFRILLALVPDAILFCPDGLAPISC